MVAIRVGEIRIEWATRVRGVGGGCPYAEACITPQLSVTIQSCAGGGKPKSKRRSLLASPGRLREQQGTYPSNMRRGTQRRWRRCVCIQQTPLPSPR